MLRQRIITALIAGPIALACVFLLPHLEFSIFIALVLIVGAWEWANFAGFEQPLRFAYAGLVAVLMGAAWFVEPNILLMVSVAWWLAAFGFVVTFPGSSDTWGSKPVVLLIGLVVLVTAFTALVELRRYEDHAYLICLLFFLIWGADVGAYFSGRALGKAKLAPSVSPGKSWEGVFGGQAAVVLLAILAHQLLELTRISLLAVVVIAVCAAAASVVGDLVESMVKRHRGVKDSGTLLPGHGGFLDRIDGITAAAPVLALGLILTGWVP